MGFKRLIKKGLLGGAGSMIEGHIFDAIQKKKETGKSFRECLSESVKETFTEDLPGTSHVYQMGKTDGRKQGTAPGYPSDPDPDPEPHAAERGHGAAASAVPFEHTASGGRDLYPRDG